MKRKRKGVNGRGREERRKWGTKGEKHGTII